MCKSYMESTKESTVCRGTKTLRFFAIIFWDTFDFEPWYISVVYMYALCMRSSMTVVYADYYFQAEKSKVAVFKISSICLHIPQVSREICILFSLAEMMGTQ